MTRAFEKQLKKQTFIHFRNFFHRLVCGSLTISCQKVRARALTILSHIYFDMENITLKSICIDVLSQGLSSLLHSFYTLLRLADRRLQDQLARIFGIFSLKNY